MRALSMLQSFKREYIFHRNIQAIVTLFLICLNSILQDSMASTYPDEGPLPWFRVEMSIFYIVFFVVFPFFFVNIFVALIIVTFNELGEAELQDDMDKNQVQLITLNHYGNHKFCKGANISYNSLSSCIFYSEILSRGKVLLWKD